VTIAVALEAQVDMQEAYRWISRHNPAAAKRLLEEFRRTFRALAAAEIQGPEVELLSGRRVNRWVVRSYRVYYRRTTAQLRILRVYHSARRPIER
jgi:plasmid stabilization system protein ParE